MTASPPHHNHHQDSDENDGSSDHHHHRRRDEEDDGDGDGDDGDQSGSIWDRDPSLDICLLEAIEQFPPLSYHKDFAVINICAEIQRILVPTLPGTSVAILPEQVEERLHELYSLQDLDKDVIDVLTLKSQDEMEEEELEDVDLDFCPSDELLRSFQEL